jgi:FKBP-type peptidyl-prolyl cis-trans isomerase FkpA
MKLKVKTAVALVLLCAACSNVKETPKGLKYTVLKKGDGVVAKPGQYLITSVLFKDAKDSTWFDSRKVDFPSPILIPDTSGIKREDGIEEIFRLISKGDSITFKIPAAVLFDRTFHQPLPPKMDPLGQFVFFLGVKNIINQEEYATMQKDMQVKQQEKSKKLMAVQLGKDTVAIDSFLRIKNIIPQKTASGLRYVVIKKGTGPNAKPGNTAKVEYAGYLMNGKYFDTNIESVGKAHGVSRPGYAPADIGVGQGAVIQGFDEAFQLMNKGAEINVYIPSTLGYGPRKRSAEIIENSILIFDLKMLDIK